MVVQGLGLMGFIFKMTAKKKWWKGGRSCILTVLLPKLRSYFEAQVFSRSYNNVWDYTIAIQLMNMRDYFKKKKTFAPKFPGEILDGGTSQRSSRNVKMMYHESMSWLLYDRSELPTASRIAWFCSEFWWYTCRAPQRSPGPMSSGWFGIQFLHDFVMFVTSKNWGLDPRNLPKTPLWLNKHQLELVKSPNKITESLYILLMDKILHHQGW